RGAWRCRLAGRLRGRGVDRDRLPNRGREGSGARPASFDPQYDQGLIVMHWSIAGEFRKVRENSIRHRFGIFAAPLEQGMSHVVAAKIFLFGVRLIGNTIGVKHYEV